MNSRQTFLFSLLGLAFIGGCAPYVEDFHYLPNPSVADVRTAPPAPAAVPTTQPAQAAPPVQNEQEPPVATTYAVVVGIRREDRKENLPLSVEVRLQIDNRGNKSVGLDPQSLQLTNSTLVQFPPPIVRGPQRLDVPPGQSLFVTANFPFPPGASYDNLDLRQLQLRWSLLIDGQPVGQMAGFQRALHYYYDPYYDRPYYPYGPYYYGHPYWGVRGTVIIR